MLSSHSSRHRVRPPTLPANGCSGNGWFPSADQCGQAGCYSGGAENGSSCDSSYGGDPAKGLRITSVAPPRSAPGARGRMATSKGTTEYHISKICDNPNVSHLGMSSK